MTVDGLTLTETADTCKVKDALDPPKVAAICTLELPVAAVMSTVKLPAVAPPDMLADAGPDTETDELLMYPIETVVPPAGAGALSVTVHAAEPGAVTEAGEQERAVSADPRVTVEPVAVAETP